MFRAARRDGVPRLFAAAPEGARGKRNEASRKQLGNDGFSAASKQRKKTRQKQISQQQYKGEAVELGKKGYTRVAKLQDFEEKQKEVVPVILGVNAYAVFRHDGELFLTDASAPPYKFPLSDATVSKDPQGRVVVEEPLTGSIFDLSTGVCVCVYVCVWCVCVECVCVRDSCFCVDARGWVHK